MKNNKTQTETCRKPHCTGNCLRKHEVFPVHFKGVDKAIKAEYWLCLKCGYEFQTDDQQMRYMQKVLESMKEEDMRPQDKAMLHSIKVYFGEEKALVKEELDRFELVEEDEIQK